MNQGLSIRDIDDIPMLEWNGLRAMYSQGLIGPFNHFKHWYTQYVATVGITGTKAPKPEEFDEGLFDLLFDTPRAKSNPAALLETWLIRDKKHRRDP